MYRPHLWRSGVELYELKPAFSIHDEPDIQGIAGSSRASLHSKTLAIDEEQIFIGSFNFDPRSLLLNTEMGVLIDSPRRDGALAAAFSKRFRLVSYGPGITGEGAVDWEDVGTAGTKSSQQGEPGHKPYSDQK